MLKKKPVAKKKPAAHKPGSKSMVKVKAAKKTIKPKPKTPAKKIEIHPKKKIPVIKPKVLAKKTAIKIKPIKKKVEATEQSIAQVEDKPKTTDELVAEEMASLSQEDLKNLA